MYKRKLTSEEANNEQSKLFNELKVMDRGIKPVGKPFSKQRQIIYWCKRKIP